MSIELQVKAVLVSDHANGPKRGRKSTQLTEVSRRERIQEVMKKFKFLISEDQTIVFARSALLTPHQRDSELVGRARFLIEQVHNPPKMNYSIAELFDIVPFVRNRSRTSNLQWS
jgi:hypothetical protein